MTRLILMASLKKQSTHGSSDLSYSNCLLGIVHLNITSNSIRLHGSDSKESASNEGDLGIIPGWGRSPGEENGYPLPCSCLKNSMNRDAWRTTVHGITKSCTGLSN